MDSSEFDRRLFLTALLGTSALGSLLTYAFGQINEGVDGLSVTREGDSSFRVARPNSSAVRVTFLNPTAMRIHVLAPATTAPDLPEYVRVKADSSYPPVKVEIHRERDEVTFKTASAILNISLGDEVISLELLNADKILIDSWEIDADERVARIELQNSERIYGFGDKRAALDQRGRRVEILNRDAFASETNLSYKSIPFFMSSAGYGLFFHNYHPSTFDIGATVRDQLQLKASGGEMDFYAFVGEMKEILSQYTDLTGRPAMLPRWAFGYHQGKATYRGREGIEVAAKMRQRKLPFDVIFYDDFDREATGKSFIDELWDRYRARLTVGFGMPMFGNWPGNDDSTLLHDLAARGYLLVDRAGKPVIGRDQHVENNNEDRSLVAYLDYFSSPAVEHVFASKWDDALRNGMLLGMVDFGEMDHLPDTNLKFWPSLKMSVAQTRNLFGLVYPLAIMNGVLNRVGGRMSGMVRPGFAGSQRLGWTTTGDSLPTYRNFRAHTRGMLNLTLSGFSNVGQDIGGWDSKGDDILYARWFAGGTFYPFMWSHGKGDHEPYSHGEVVESATRTFLNLRYRLIPYLYSLHEVAHRTGVPVLRSFPLQEPEDPIGFRLDDQFFVGEHLMVAPLFEDDDRTLYLPKGLWYDFFGEQQPINGGRSIERESVPLHRLPVYVRAGAVVPLGPAMQHTGERPVDPLSVHIYGFAAGDLAHDAATSIFSLYEDDGISVAYLNGEFQRTHFRFRQSNDRAQLAVDIESGDGKYQSVSSRGYRLHFHGVERKPTYVRIDGQVISRAESYGAAVGAMTWSNNEWAGEVSVFIPSMPLRPFTVEFAS